MTAPLGEVADVQLGKMLDRKRTEGTSLPYLRNVNVRWGHIDVSDLLDMPFRDHELNRYSVKPGDVMVCEGGEPGRAAVWTRHDHGIKYQKALHRVRLGGGLLPNWLVYQLQLDASSGRLSKQFSGTTIGHLPREAIVQYGLRLAPLREQRRIVEAIESYFTRLDDAVATLERVQRNLKRYRASVLKAAVEGRLVPTEAELARAEGRDYEPASVLLERILAERRRRWHEAGGRGKYQEPVGPDTSGLAELLEGWCWANLTLLKEFSLYGPRFSSDAYADEGRLVLRTSDISESGKVVLATAPRLPLDDEEFAKYRVEVGDLLVTRTGSLGTLAVFNDSVDAIPGAYLIQFRLVAPRETSWFCFYLLKSPTGQTKLKAGGAGVGRPNLNAPTIESIAFGMPPLAEQARIVVEVERLLSVADALDHEVGTNLVRCARLRQAILKWAFEGKLVDQDPSDEPASALLERIRSQILASRPNAGDTGVSHTRWRDGLEGIRDPRA